MDSLTRLLEALRRNPNNVRHANLCDAYFGELRHKAGSHRIYCTPWPNDPRVNIQNAEGRAQPYQVRQVIKAIEK